MKHFKKIFAIVSLTAAAAMCFAACGGNPELPAEHKHEYSSAWSYDAQNHWHDATCEHDWLKGDVKPHNFTEEKEGEETCTAGTTITRTCSCGYSYTYESAPLGHDWQLQAGTPASCTADGVTDYYKCSRCGDVKDMDTIQSPGHVYRYTEDTIDDSEHWRVCIFCGQEEAGSRTPHTYGTTPDSYEKEGNQHWQVCPDCGYVSAKEAHVFGDLYESNDAQHWQICEKCGVATAKEDHAFNGGFCECGKQEGEYVDYFTYEKNGDAYTVTGFKAEIPSGTTRFSILATHRESGDAAALPVTAIAPSAFRGNTTVTQIFLPGSITSIGDYAFEGCTALQAVNLPDSLTTLGTRDYQVFNGCSALQHITLPAAITQIGANMFKNCTNLEQITVKGHVTSIDTQAFYGCTKLGDISITGSLTYVGQRAFAESGLLALRLTMATGGRIAEGAFTNCAKLQTLTITGGLNYFSAPVLKGCDKLQTLTLPFVGSHADAAQAVNTDFGYIFGAAGEGYAIPATLETVNVKGGTVAIGAFANCGALTVNADAAVEVMTKTFADYTGTFNWNGTLPGPTLTGVSVDKSACMTEEEVTLSYTAAPAYGAPNETTVNVTVTKDGQAAVEGTDYTVEGKVYTFKTAGTFTLTVTATYNGITSDPMTATVTVDVPGPNLSEIGASGTSYESGACNIDDAITLTFTYDGGADTALRYTVKKNGTEAAASDYELDQTAKTITFNTAGVFVVEVQATRNGKTETKDITITASDPNANKPHISGFTASTQTLEEGATGATLTTNVTFDEGDGESGRSYYVEVKEMGGSDYVNADSSYYEITDNVFKAKVAGEYRIKVTVSGTQGGMSTFDTPVTINVTPVDLEGKLSVSAEKLTNGWVRVATGGNQTIEYSTDGAYIGGYTVGVVATNGAQASAGDGAAISVSLAEPNTSVVTVTLTHKNIPDTTYSFEIPVSFVTDVAGAPVLGEDPFGGMTDELLNSTGLQLDYNVTDKAADGTQLDVSAVTFAQVANDTGKTLTIEHIAGVEGQPYYMILEDFSDGHTTGNVSVKLTATQDGKSAAATKSFKVTALSDPSKSDGMNAYLDKVMASKGGRGAIDAEGDSGLMKRKIRESSVFTQEGIVFLRDGIANGGASWEDSFAATVGGTYDNFQIDFTMQVIKRITSGDDNNRASIVINYRGSRFGDWIGGGDTVLYVDGSGNELQVSESLGGKQETTWEGSAGKPDANRLVHFRMTHTVSGGKAWFDWTWSYDGTEGSYNALFKYNYASTTENGQNGSKIHSMHFRYTQGSFSLGNFKVTNLDGE